MSFYQRLLSHILICVAFFQIWVRIVLDHFYTVGRILNNLPSGIELIFWIGIPFLLLILVLYFKSSKAFGFTMILFGLMILISIGNLPDALDYHLNAPKFESDNPPMGGLETCIKTLIWSAIGFALMNTKTLLAVYNWDTIKSRMTFFIAMSLYLLDWIFRDFL